MKTKEGEVVRYIELDNILVNGKFRQLTMCGVNFEQTIYSLNINYVDGIVTVLSPTDFERISLYNDNIADFNNYAPDVDKYTKGAKEFENIKSIVNLLRSSENAELFRDIVQEEIEFLSTEYDLTIDEATSLLVRFPGRFRDRVIVKTIYRDIEDFGMRKARAFGLPEEFIEYFYATGYGTDILNDENYYTLKDKRIIEYNV